MPDPLLDQYADSAELAVYWRALSAGEVVRADDLLVRAATLINEEPAALTFTESACNAVSLDMVKRAMIGGGGIMSGSQSMADMSATVQYVNPVGNLYLTERELRRLRGKTPPTGSIKPTNNAAVPPQVWNRQDSVQADAST